MQRSCQLRRDSGEILQLKLDDWKACLLSCPAHLTALVVRGTGGGGRSCHVALAMVLDAYFLEWFRHPVKHVRWSMQP